MITRQRKYLSMAVFASCCAIGLAFLNLGLRPDNDANNVLRVGLYENEPKIYTGADGRPAGLFVELLQKIADNEGWRLEFHNCEWAKCLEALGEGELDIMPDVAFTIERDRYLDFHTTAVAQSWSQFYRPRFDTIRSLRDLTGKRIALLRGSVQEHAVAEILSKAGVDYQPILVDSIAATFARVQQGDADVAVSNNFYGGRHGASFDLLETPLTFNQVGLYFAVAKGRHAGLLAAIDEHLNTWMTNPESIYYSALRSATSTPKQISIPVWLTTLLWSIAAATAVLLGAVVTLRWRIQQRTVELKASNQRLHHVLNGSPVIIYSVIGHQTKPRWVSSNVKRILGFSADAALNEGWWKRQLHPDDRVKALQFCDDAFKDGHLSIEYRLFDASGKVRYIRDERQRLRTNLPGEQDEIIGSWTDLTESFENQAKLSHLTHYDPLTGLPNRLLMHERLHQALNDAQTRGRRFHVICIDFDRFKQVNESLGISVGDQVLVTIAERLKNLLTSKKDTLSRTGADEFSLLLAKKLGEDTLAEYMDKLLEQLRMPLVFNDQSVILTASVGVCAHPEDGQTAEQIMRNSEMAMFAAKHQGGNCWRRYNPQLSADTGERFHLENALRHAIRNDELLLHYQPQFQLNDGLLAGVEALVRWQRVDGSIISPATFIPLAEEIGIIGELDAWVLKTACRQLRDWDAQGLHVPRVAVNLSALELENTNLRQCVENSLLSAGLESQRLELEITESMLMRAPEKAIANLNHMRAMGVHLAMDDFGTGYSNLAHLGNLPINTLKIDQSFIRTIGRAKHNESIIRAIIALADVLDLSTIAEGIETPEQQEFLQQEHCTTGQGFLLCRPCDADTIFSILASKDASRIHTSSAISASLNNRVPSSY